MSAHAGEEAVEIVVAAAAAAVVSAPTAVAIAVQSQQHVPRALSVDSSPDRFDTPPVSSLTHLGLHTTQHRTTASDGVREDHALLRIDIQNGDRQHDDTDAEDASEHRAVRRPFVTSPAVGGSPIAGSPANAVVEPPPARWIMIVSYLALAGSVLSQSSSAPMYHYLQHHGISPILACVWRHQCTCMFLLIPAIIEWHRLPAKERAWDRFRVKGTGSGRRKVTRIHVAHAGAEPTLRSGYVRGQDWHAAWYVCAVSVVWSCSLVLWTSALPFTSTARASLLTSIYPLLLVIWLKFGDGVTLSTGEILGVLVSFGGIAATEVASMSEETTFNRDPPDQNLLLSGDLLCLGAAFFIAADIVVSKKARQVVPLFTYTILTSFLTLLILTGLSMILEDVQLFSSDPARGVFGWMTNENNMLAMTTSFGFLEGAVGILGFNFAVKYIPHLVFSSVQLLDPGVTGLMSYFCGLEEFPSSSTFLGIAIVTAGISVTVIQQHKRELAEQALAQQGATVGGLSSPNGTATLEMTSTSASAAASPQPRRLIEYQRVDKQSEA